ncbi:protein eva-1 homolog B isoform X2 [Notamacropus eugenii]|uniref:protein eva-1 homolog B isoform X2 n=1 Tax=Notamacropus eugenii TaxID=9315 RepID=UPI003B6811EC
MEGSPMGRRRAFEGLEVGHAVRTGLGMRTASPPGRVIKRWDWPKLSRHSPFLPPSVPLQGRLGSPKASFLCRGWGWGAGRGRSPLPPPSSFPPYPSWALLLPRRKLSVRSVGGRATAPAPPALPNPPPDGADRTSSVPLPPWRRWAGRGALPELKPCLELFGCADQFRGLPPSTLLRRNMEARKRDMELLSNSLAAYAYVRDHPESFGLYFVLGICFGLLLTLCLLVIRISCRPHPRPSGKGPQKISRGDLPDGDEDEDEDETDTMTRLGPDDAGSGPELTPEMDSPLSVNVFTSAEELERAQRLEERERILREIWRTGQPDLLGTGTGTVGRVHYY